MRPKANEYLPHYGGQAVIEGVMMRGRQLVAIAIRKRNLEIIVHKERLNPLLTQRKILRFPFIRGVFALFDHLLLGMRALHFSANVAIEDIEGKPAKSGTLALPIFVGLALGIGLFVVLPNLLAGKLRILSSNVIYLNLIEGFYRIALFLLYLFGISLLKDIRRIFQYHGAEHKVINAYEAGEELQVEKIAKFDTFHPRCGTAFIIIVLLMSILVFSFLGWQVWYKRILLRLAFLPLVVGISYEVIRLTAKYKDSKVMQLLIAPGLWIQRITTQQPAADQLEVALVALRTILEEEHGEAAEE